MSRILGFLSATLFALMTVVTSGILATPAFATTESCPAYICGSIDTEDDAFAVSGETSIGPRSSQSVSPGVEGVSLKSESKIVNIKIADVAPDRMITITQVYCFTLEGVGQLDCFESERSRCTSQGSQLVVLAQYPANNISAIERTSAPFCSEASSQVVNDPAEGVPDAPPMPVVTLEDFRNLDIKPSTIESDSGGFGLIRANTNFYAREEVQTLNTVMLEQQVAIQAIPVQWTFDYGDGTAPLVSSSPGGPQREFNQHTTTSHAYQDTGTFPVNVSTAYRGQFSVNGGPWIAIPGTASVPSAPVEADIWRSESKNVAEDCDANPGGWACGDPFIEQ